MIVLIAMIIVVIIVFTFNFTGGSVRCSVMDFAIKHYDVKPVKFEYENPDDFKKFPTLSERTPKLVENIKDLQTDCMVSTSGNNDELCVFTSTLKFLVLMLSKHDAKMIVIIRANYAKIFNILAEKFPGGRFIILDDDSKTLQPQNKSLVITNEIKDVLPNQYSIFYLDFKSSKKKFLEYKNQIKPDNWFFASCEHVPCCFISILPWSGNKKAVGMSNDGSKIVKANLDYYTNVYKPFAFHQSCKEFIGNGFDGCADCCYLLSMLQSYDSKFLRSDTRRDLLALQNSTNFFNGGAHGFFTKPIKNISDLGKNHELNKSILISKSKDFNISQNLPNITDGIIAFKLPQLKKQLCALNWWDFANQLAICEGVSQKDLQYRKQELRKTRVEYKFSDKSNSLQSFAVIKVDDLTFSVSEKILDSWKVYKYPSIPILEFKKTCLDACFRNSSDALCLKLNTSVLDELVQMHSVKNVINLCDDFTRSAFINCGYKKPFSLYTHYPKLNPINAKVKHFLSLIPDSSLVYIESRIPDYLTTHILYSMTEMRNRGVYFIFVLYDYPHEVAFWKKMLIKAKMICCNNSLVPKSLSIATNIKSESLVLDLFYN